jgi:adenine phosphoribosyltransferase
MNHLAEKILQTIENVPDFPNSGIMFKDISPVFFSPDLIKDMVGEMALSLKTLNPEILFGIESRGFLLGVPVAVELGIPFAMIRKSGKLPGEVMGVSYDLEYGSASIEIQNRQSFHSKRAVLIDDVLATGGTAMAAFKLLKSSGVKPVGMAVLLELTNLRGREVILPLGCDIISLAQTE